MEQRSYYHQCSCLCTFASRTYGSSSYMFGQAFRLLCCFISVLFSGEVIPQAICSGNTGCVSSNVVCILMIIWYQIGYPIVKILDCVLGYNEALFRRAQLKALVSIHSKAIISFVGKRGELTHDETTFLSGALDLTETTAEDFSFVNRLLRRI